MGDIYIEQILYMGFNLFYPRVIKFKYLTRIIENEVVVLNHPAGFLKLGIVGPKLMFGHKPAIQQQLDRVVQRSPADPVFVVLHPDI